VTGKNNNNKPEPKKKILVKDCEELSDSRFAFTRTTPAKVFILDDHPIVRRGIAELIEQDSSLNVCGESDEYHAALEAIDKLRPDIVLVDISLGGSSGIEFLRMLKQNQPNILALVISMHDEVLYAEHVLREGARGYIMKQEATEKVLTAIHRVLTGQIFLSEKMTERVLEKQYAGISVDVSPVESLSERELEVFRMIGEGSTTAAIAQQFHRSIKTIETYRARIKSKLNLKHNMELIRLAVHWVQK
jgi:DNA-binding NarL/FixJ family response regulator